MKMKNAALPGAILIMCIIAGAVGSRTTPQASDETQQLVFLTGFYKDYLSTGKLWSNVPLQPGSFYSRKAEALIAANAAMCTAHAGNDEICGYGADGDVFLDAQEIAPDLDYQRARFKARPAGKDMVEVSFNVYPQLGVNGQRALRYVLVREDGHWRVDNVFFAVDGAFPVTESMRYQISEEDQRLAADLLRKAQ